MCAYRTERLNKITLVGSLYWQDRHPSVNCFANIGDANIRFTDGHVAELSEGLQ